VGGASYDDVNGNIYYADVAPPGGTNYIRRVAKNSSTSTTVKSSSTVRFYSPRSNGSMLYFFYQDLSNGSFYLRRKNLSNGNEVGVSFPFAWYEAPLYLTWVGPDGIYFLQHFDSPIPGHWSLYRTQL
jgi:hypothetical protein